MTKTHGSPGTDSSVVVAVPFFPKLKLMHELNYISRLGIFTPTLISHPIPRGHVQCRHCFHDHITSLLDW